MPVGPHILWPVNATKSAPQACTSVSRWGTYWLASTTAIAPASWAAVTSRSMGLMVPSTFDMAANDTTRAPSTRRSRSVRSRWPSAPRGIQRSSIPSSSSELVPRHDVGVVLELGEHHRIALAQVRSPPRLRDEVERLGGVLGEHHLPGPAATDERGDLRPGALERGGGLLGDHVGASMDVRVRLLVERLDRVEDGAGLLRGVRRVEVHEPLAVHLAVEDREVLLDRRGVERHVGTSQRS